MKAFKLARAVLQFLCAAIMLALGTVLGLILVPFLGGPKAVWVVARRYCQALAWMLGVRHEMRGWQALPEELREGRRPAIYIANHTSNLDAVLVVCHLPVHPVFLAKREVVFVPLLGFLVWLSGAVLVNRRNREEAILSLKRAAERVRAGVNIMAFPEGTRSRTGVLALPLKKGVFNMAQQADVPVVPLALLGAHALLPCGTLCCEPGPFLMRVGQPLYPGDYADVDGLREAAERSLADLLQDPPAVPGQVAATVGLVSG